MSEYRFDPVTKDPAETLDVTLNLFNLAANFWAPNEYYAADEVVRPSKANGFAYKVTTAGLSASREPVWPTISGNTKPDGTVVWTAQDAGSTGVNAVTSPSAVASPSGELTITGVDVLEQYKIVATYAAGLTMRDYEAVFSFTLKGRARVARQLVRVRPR